MAVVRKRSTVNVKEILAYGNEQLKRTDEFANQKFKAGVCVMIEKVLHESRNYQGFNHIYWMEKGFIEWNDNGKPDFPEKDKYIYGEGGEEGTYGNYSRHYYDHIK